MINPLDYLEKIQNRPEHERMLIAAVTVAALITIIVSAWLATFSISAVDTAGVAAPMPTAEANQPPPFELLWNLVKDYAKK